MAQDSTSQADDLEVLARRRFGKLSEAEVRLLRAASNGDCAICGPIPYPDPANDPADADVWGSEREVRAELIRWLCVVPEAAKRVAPPGVQVRAARIAGTLDLSFATVAFALSLAECRLARIDLRWATIPGLNLTGSLVESLHADGVDVRTTVFLNWGFSAGEVRLSGAQIGGSLRCDRGIFKNPGGDALNAENIEVRGQVLLAGFLADGKVRLSGAQIGKDLTCEGGTFGVVDLERAVVKKVFFWRHVQGSTYLDLSDASVGVLTDDQASWPPVGRLRLDGFTYDHTIASPTDAEMRLDWIGRQQEFAPQPYRQLAKVLREMGDEDGAKQVLFELESRVRAEDLRRVVHSPLGWLLRSTGDAVSDLTVGYGIYPGRAIWCLFGLTVLGWIVHRRAQRVGAMAPTDKDASVEFSKGQIPKNYQPFNPLIYSLENCVPLVKLGQDERWQPDPHPKRREPVVAKGKFRRAIDAVLDKLVPNWAATPAALRWFRWIMIGLGWLLATFFVAGLTGIIRAG